MQTSRERQRLRHCYVSLQVLSVVGLLQDETDPMVSVMKVQPAALTYAAWARYSLQHSSTICTVMANNGCHVYNAHDS